MWFYLALTCIEVDNNGASLSSFPTFATLLCTFTKAFSSFDSSKLRRNSISCASDKLSASFSDDISFETAREGINIINLVSGK